MTLLVAIILAAVAYVIYRALSLKTSAPPPEAPAYQESRRAAPEKQWQLVPALVPLELICAQLDEQAPGNVISQSMPDQHRRVDLAARTCSCPDFVKRRSHLSRNDIRRLCKHAVDLIAERRLDKHFPSLQRSVVYDRFFTSFDAVHAHQISEIKVAIAFKRGDEWINLFAPTATRVDPQVPPDRVPHGRSGYNLRERRWAHAAAPRWIKGASEAIRAAFRKE